ncbi:hypothetical protein [Streptomyces sp. WAC06614]|uniref:hypothetical protein n=1 Tax=Streptomyces sp. WAC06614 TaxID=2487416 RepID=UPI000F79289A|nr:hypothetical protein [Streptomyces sp. WAC06614]RSS64731.1 hypothetical protein EF918_30235 [Streptomyces sp. WAC06614]
MARSAGSGSGSLVVEVRPLIDGVDVIAAAFEDADHGVRCGDPRGWLVPDGPLTVGDRPHRVDVAERWCGCHPALSLLLRREGDTVVWTWEPEGEAGITLPEYRFDATSYDAELARAAQDPRWEWPARTTARLLRDALRSEPARLARWSCELGHVWTDPRFPDHVLVYFLRDERSTDGAWHRVEEFGGTFPVDAREPARAATELARSFLSGDDPRAVAGVRFFPAGVGLPAWLGGHGHYHDEGPTPWKTYH